MPRLTADQWAAVRIEWEGEPTTTFNGLASKHGVDKASISRKAAKEGWSKRGILGDINEAAQRKADARCDSEGNVTQRKRNTEDLASRDLSEDLRAEVIERHRREWSELESFRKVALKAMKEAHESGDKIAWQIAKTAADTAVSNLRALEIKQTGERKAWGLEQQAEQDVVIKNPRNFDAG